MPAGPEARGGRATGKSLKMARCCLVLGSRRLPVKPWAPWGDGFPCHLNHLGCLPFLIQEKKTQQQQQEDTGVEGYPKMASSGTSIDAVK